MRPLILAIQFLTIVTLRSDLRAGPEELARSRHWYGLVGILLGLGLALDAWFLGLFLPPLPVAALLVLAWGAYTRFLHLDGVADTADALVYYSSRERALAILKDTRIGAFGLAAVVCLLLIKFAALASLSGRDLYAGLVIAPTLARGLCAGLSAALPPATPGRGLGAGIGSQASLTPLWASGGTALAAAVLIGGLGGLVAALAVLVLGVILGAWYMARLGGVTGDPLGASLEAAECVALLAWCAWV